MNNILIKNAHIINQASKFNGKKMDILIENGIIKSIRKKIEVSKNCKIIESENLHVSCGWFDMQADFCDPGYEYKEDILSGIQAAAAGGFTGVAVVPSTSPAIQNKGGIEYIKNRSKGAIVDIYPIGCLSVNKQGEDISEMYDMHKAGAVAFYDDKKNIDNAGLLSRALLYSKNFNGLVITHCSDSNLSKGGQMNEGITSTYLGLKGMPSIAEELMVHRNITLAEYTESPIHIANVSTTKSVALIKQAKAKGIKVTASVNAYNLVIDDSVLKDFDSNYKLNPPLRTLKDIEALIKGVEDKTIDVITSDHRPQDIESKMVEFNDASWGMIGLETFFALLNRSGLKLETIIHAITVAPRSILNLHQPSLEEGESANITLFDPDKLWTFGLGDIKSKSKNSPFVGTTFRGRSMGVINNGLNSK